ncbi:uncharacterized protein LOC134835527 [Culicoides brevitarsis]|uniref:uncharacterized protein LOC134835527 n=1 Tax=Culicoides brevitarsis TaxID=469753 RepID=UPI00307BD1BF
MSSQTPELKICYRNSPTQERNECLRESISKIIPVLKNGYPEFNIPSIDPFYHDKTHFEYKQGILTVNLNTKDMIVNGVRFIKIKEVRSKANDKNIYVEIDADFDRLEMLADYKGNAVLSELNVKSGGKLNLTAVDITTTLKILGKINKSENSGFIAIKGIDLSNIDTKKMIVHATGLFPDPDVNQFAVEFINQSWRYLFEQLIPEIKKIWLPMCEIVAKGFFENVPYDVLMPKKK